MVWSSSSRSGSDGMKELLGRDLSSQKTSDLFFYYYPSFRWTSESQTQSKLDRLPYSCLSFMTFPLVLGLCYSLIDLQKREEELLPLPYSPPPLSVPLCATRKPLLHHNCINSIACPGLGNGVGTAASSVALNAVIWLPHVSWGPHKARSVPSSFASAQTCCFKIPGLEYFDRKCHYNLSGIAVLGQVWGPTSGLELVGRKW